MNTNLVNLTPHDIVILIESGDRLVIPKSGKVARVTTIPGQCGVIYHQDLPVAVQTKDTVGQVIDLPDPVDGTAYIVSGLVGSLAPRADVLVPGTAPADQPERNEKGHIIAVRVLKATA